MENNETQPVDINAATADELAALPGLEPEQAEAIVDYRAAHGPFDNAAQVVRVEGIDDTTYNIFLHGRIVAHHPDETAPVVDEVDEPAADVSVVGPAEGEGMVGEPPAEDVAEPDEEVDEDLEGVGPTVVEEPDEVELDEEEVVTAAEPRFAEPPPPPPPPPQRRGDTDGDGCMFTVLEWLVLIFLGTVLGAALTLGILYAVNGTLDFSNVRGVRQAASALSQLQREQAQLAADLDALELQSDQLSQSVVNLQDRFDTLEEYTGTLRNELERTSVDIGAMQEEVGILQSDVEAVATESADFDNFLTRLRDVLIEVQGTPVPTTTPTPTTRPTRMPTSTATSSPTSTATSVPTSTPRVSPTGTTEATTTRTPAATIEATATETPAATTEPTTTGTPAATPTTGSSATPTPTP